MKDHSEITKGDPVAELTDWTPCRRGGTNFKAEKVVVRGDRVVICKSIGFIIFASLFFLSGLGMLVAIPFVHLEDGFQGAAIMGFVGLVFSVAGGFLLFMKRTFTFDRMLGMYYLGRRVQRDETISPQKQGTFSKIHAIQLISEHISGSKSSYNSYEMNLVLKDGQRINVMDHGNHEAIRTSATKLRDFLGVPLWDVT